MRHRGTCSPTTKRRPPSPSGSERGMGVGSGSSHPRGCERETHREGGKINREESRREDEWDVGSGWPRARWAKGSCEVTGSSFLHLARSGPRPLINQNIREPGSRTAVLKGEPVCKQEVDWKMCPSRSSWQATEGRIYPSIEVPRPAAVYMHALCW